MSDKAIELMNFRRELLHFLVPSAIFGPNYVPTDGDIQAALHYRLNGLDVPKNMDLRIKSVGQKVWTNLLDYFATVAGAINKSRDDIEEEFFNFWREELRGYRLMDKYLGALEEDMAISGPAVRKKFRELCKWMRRRKTIIENYSNFSIYERSSSGKKRGK